LSLLTLLLLSAIARPADPKHDFVAETFGNFVLEGGGKMPTTVRARFLDLAGNEKARIVVIPGGAAAPDASQVLAPWKALGVSATLMHTRDRRRAEEQEFVKPLAEATGVWLGDGDPVPVAATYRGTAVERELRKLLSRGGVIGASADCAPLTGKLLPGGPRQVGATRGFGWLPTILVDTHFLKGSRIDRLQMALARQPGLVGLGIDDGAAVVIQGRRLRTMGSSYVSFCLAPGNRRPASTQILPAGHVADLVALERAAEARSQSPFPADKPAVPNVAHGTLIIGGGGGLAQDVFKRFIELAGGPDALIVVVPTALEDPVPADPAELRTLRRAGAKNLKLLHTRQRSEADSPEFAAPLRRAGGVWFSGGRQWHFVDAYEGTLTEKLFHEVLQRGGVIAGSSAGASIQSEYMVRGHPLGNEVMMAEGYERGFGFLPGAAVDQHFFARKRTGDMSSLMDTYPQELGIGIDEGTVIVVKRSMFEVMGKSKVAVYDRRKPRQENGKDYEELPAGARYDMVARTILPSSNSALAEKPKPAITHSFLACGQETFIVDGQGKVSWRYPHGSRDGWVLANGDVLLALSKGEGAPGGSAVEVTRAGKVVFEFKGTQAEVNTVQPLDNGNTLVTEAGAMPRLLEIDRRGKIAVEVPLQAQTKDHHLQTRMARKLANGNYLVPQLLDQVVREYTPKGQIVWEAKTPHWPFTAIRLENGHTLIGCTLGNLVIEVDAQGKTVWQLSNADLPDKPINDACGIQRLPNGNTVITSHHATANQVKLLEVTPDKKIVWTYTDGRNAGIHHFQVLDTNGVPLQGKPLR